MFIIFGPKRHKGAAKPTRGQPPETGAEVKSREPGSRGQQ